jgi:hypothetical protein
MVSAADFIVAISQSAEYGPDYLRSHRNVATVKDFPPEVERVVCQRPGFQLIVKPLTDALGLLLHIVASTETHLS